MPHNFKRNLSQKRILVVLGVLSSLFVLKVLAQEDTSPASKQPQLRVEGEWPLAPQDVKDPPPERVVATIDVEDPTTSPPPVNPMLSIMEKSAFKGRIVYTPSLQVGKPRAQQYLVFHSLSYSKTLKAQPTSVVTYHANTTWRIWDPQIAPDGTSMLFKLADQPSHSYYSYAVFLWNFNNNSFKRMRAPLNLNFRRVYWSPDSKHIAFVSGGDRGGNVPAHFEPLQLHIYDVQTGKERMIVENPSVTRMAWTKQNTLLFTMELSEEAKKDKPGEEEGARKQRHAAIYEVAPNEGSVPKIVIPNGFYPQPSPDGKWIAYVAQPAPKKPGDKPGGEDGQDVPRAGLVVNGRIASGLGFYLWNRQTGKRTLIGPADLNSYRWTPDSAHIVTLNESYRTVKGDKAQGEGKGLIGVVDVPSLTSHDVTTLTAHDHEPIPRSEIWPQFEPQVSNDGKTLFVKQSEFIQEEHGYQTEHKTLLAVDLATGKTQLLARLLNKYTNIVGWDFHDDSPPWKPAP